MTREQKDQINLAIKLLWEEIVQNVKHKVNSLDSVADDDVIDRLPWHPGWPKNNEILSVVSTISLVEVVDSLKGNAQTELKSFIESRVSRLIDDCGSGKQKWPPVPHKFNPLEVAETLTLYANQMAGEKTRNYLLTTAKKILENSFEK